MQASPGDGVVGKLSIVDDPVVKDTIAALLRVQEGLLLDAVHLTHTEAKQSCHISPLDPNRLHDPQLLLGTAFICPLEQLEKSQTESDVRLGSLACK